MVATIKTSNVPIRSWAPIHEIDSLALTQLKAVASLPWVAHHVAVMPDVHPGKGATVGSVIALRAAVAPAAVGVDIGCGMMASRTNVSAGELPDGLRELRLAIEAVIPVGRRQHTEMIWDNGRSELRRPCQALFERFAELSPAVEHLFGRARLQLGSLGGGNHFIELCLDSEERVWVLLHSGSRNVGAALAEHHMAIAAKLSHNRALRSEERRVGEGG